MFKLLNRHLSRFAAGNLRRNFDLKFRRFAHSPALTKAPKAPQGGRLVPGLLLAILLALGPGYYLIKPAYKEQEEKETEKVVRIDSVPFVEYVLIGGGTATFGAIEAIREREPEADVLVISQEDWIPYQRPPLSKELWKSDKSDQLLFENWQGQQTSLLYKGSYYFINESNFKQVGMKTLKTKFMAKTVVEKVDLEQQLVNLKQGQIQYGKLLIATGGNPRIPSFAKNLDVDLAKKVTTFRTVLA